MKNQHEFPNPYEFLYRRIDHLENLIIQLIQAQSCVGKEDKLESELLTVREAADFLHISSSTIYSLSSKRKIPFMKKGRRLYFTKENLREWLEEGNHPPTNPKENHQHAVQQFLKPRMKKLGS